MAQVTLKDVARAAGVHFTTVSLALRNSPSIPESTRERIRKIADRMGYVANPIYAALTRRRQRSGGVVRPPRLAYLVNRPPELGYRQLPHHPLILKGARRQATALGYELEVLFVDELHYTSEKLAAHLKKEDINGFIIAGFEPGLSGLMLDWSQFSIVKIDSLHMEPAVSLVTNDQERILRMVFQKLRGLGYRKIGLAVGRADDACTNRRYTGGWLIEQVRLDPAERVPPLLFPYNPKREDVVQLLRRWGEMHKIDAVISTWNTIDEVLRAAGFSVPDEVAAACLCLGEQDTGVSGAVANLEVVGAQAVSVLAQQIRAGKKGVSQFPTTTLIPGEWRDGNTTPPKHSEQYAEVEA